MTVEAKVKETIEAWEQDNMIMFIILPRLHSRNYYIIDGVETKGGQIICDVVPTVTKVQLTTEVVHWESTDKSETRILEPKDYTAQRNLLLSHQCVN